MRQLSWIVLAAFLSLPLAQQVSATPAKNHWEEETLLRHYKNTVPALTSKYIDSGKVQ